MAPTVVKEKKKKNVRFDDMTGVDDNEKLKDDFLTEEENSIIE